MLNKKICKKCRNFNQDYGWDMNTNNVWESGLTIICKYSYNQDGVTKDCDPPENCLYYAEHIVLGQE